MHQLCKIVGQFNSSQLKVYILDVCRGMVYAQMQPNIDCSRMVAPELIHVQYPHKTKIRCSKFTLYFSLIV